MANLSNQPLARITPLESSVAGRTLNPWFNAWLACKAFVVAMALQLVLMMGCAFLTSFFVGSIEVGMAMFLLTVLVCFVCMVFGPGVTWMMNRSMHRRFFHKVDLRANPIISPFDTTAKVVALIPRERWKKAICWSMATDLMLMEIDDRGVWMKGDWYGYELPAESIMAVECETIREPISVSCRHLVLIHVRTADGMVELPIGFLNDELLIRKSQWHARTVDLSEQIRRIAKGHRYCEPMAPVVNPVKQSELSMNPYAAPVDLS
ncbi:MAG: hypothetical protein AB8B91_11535 [Rubripirellula sp.]